MSVIAESFKNYLFWLLKVVTLFILVALFFGVILPGMREALEGAASLNQEKHPVAVVELDGEIIDGKEVVNQLYKQASDDKIKGIVLRINSPGGAVGPSQDIATAVARLKTKKPIIASMGSVAASGGLYSALTATKVFAEPGTITGSIGVIMQSPNATQLTKWAGVEFITIKSGKLKDVGNPFREMTEEERSYLEGLLKGVHGEFIDAVAQGRNLPREEVLKFADGRILTGLEAKELKLIDEFGNVYDAARAVFEALGEPLPPDEQPTLVYPSDRFSEIRQIFSGLSRITRIFSRAVELRFEMLGSS